MATSRTTDCEFDKLGRINIPQVLRNEANLQKECVIVGAGDHIEIWDGTTWDSFYDDNVDKFDDISEDIDDEE
ncbi:division/cell wall cluster transcriptional repressor MraZ [Allocoprobacillus halotolerans]|uniref:Transcriptional regulator MraZ n=1 Tax=Allocoprobacillus halotolerans TaxID=2944914 RepID=A0ABY5I302_9FIRM|nr:division/cell wall cluster transcriptional repressor MraZ [Allocoprobacillus halotolerans]UTY39340.1 division/cell wall cluster transcriptional repressor MraZ [Allocoprobacillus halotolerans]